jgi:hypothetical protein
MIEEVLNLRPSLSRLPAVYMQRKTPVRSRERLGIIDEKIVTAIFGQTSSIRIHCHSIDGNRDNIADFNPRKIHEKLNAVWDFSRNLEIARLFTDATVKIPLNRPLAREWKETARKA